METVKGFKEYSGEEAIKRAEIRKVILKNFERYGYEPAETPIIEFREFVRGDNTDDEAVSEIFKLEDRGGRELALRYEFTFQLKRLMNNKKIPYKRYQMGQVFRDEPVKKNRFREFTQCDIDTIGSDIYDEAEVLAAVKRILKELEIKNTIYINNRKLLNEILEKENLEKMDFDKIIRLIDKFEKLSEDELYNELRAYGAQNLIEIFKNPVEYFEKYSNYSEIKNLVDCAKLYGIEIVYLPTLARGLSYYNGSVFEVKTEEMKETIIAGGSYIFNGVQSTGLSFGLDRLNILCNKKLNINKIMVISIGQEKEAIKIIETLRDSGFNCMINFSKVSKALEYANQKNFNKVIFLGQEEVKNNKIKIKDMVSGSEVSTTLEEFIKENKTF